MTAATRRGLTINKIGRHTTLYSEAFFVAIIIMAVAWTYFCWTLKQEPTELTYLLILLLALFSTILSEICGHVALRNALTSMRECRCTLCHYNGRSIVSIAPTEASHSPSRVRAWRCPECGESNVGGG